VATFSYASDIETTDCSEQNGIEVHQKSRKLVQAV